MALGMEFGDGNNRISECKAEVALRHPFQGKIFDSLTGLGRFLFREAFRRGRKIGLSFRFQEINEAVALESDEEA